MRAKTGGGTCPGCGTAGAQPGQLVCRGCYAPFALMVPATEADERTDENPVVGEGAAVPVHGDDPQAEHTRIIARPPATAPGSDPPRRDAPTCTLRLRFPGDQVISIEPGQQIRLGREPRLCPAVGFLAAHDNLSRLHATVAVAADGSASITDEGSTNGTFLRGYRLPPNEAAALNPGDTVRFAADVIVRVLP